MRVKINGQLGSANSLYNSFLLFLRLLLTILASAAAVSAQQKTLSQEKRLEIEKAVSTFMSANSVPGMGAAVVLDGEPVWSAGFGMADLEDSAPATSSTLFRLGSLSKPITATALLQLWEHGKLDLDAPVQKYCPAFPQREWPITARELLAHLGGIRHYHPNGKGDIPEDSVRHFASMEESLHIFAADPLVAKPGTKFNYSTYGYTLVGCVLEGAASEKYVDYVRDPAVGSSRTKTSASCASARSSATLLWFPIESFLNSVFIGISSRCASRAAASSDQHEKYAL